MAPESRIVYVDNDPLVLVHARALLTSAPGGMTSYIEADVRDSAEILGEAARTLDFSQPVALMMLGIMGELPDSAGPPSIVTTLLDALPPGMIVLLYVEPNSTDLWVSLCSSHSVVVYGAVDTVATPGWRDIHALDPPKDAVAPITPFIGDHQLPEQLAAVGLFQFGDHEEATVGGFKQGDGAAMQAVEIEAAAFCFKSHGCTERCDRRRIFWPGESDIQVVEDWHGA